MFKGQSDRIYVYASILSSFLYYSCEVDQELNSCVQICVYICIYIYIWPENIRGKIYFWILVSELIVKHEIKYAIFPQTSCR